MCNVNENEFFFQPNLYTALMYSLHIGNNFNRKFTSFTLLTSIALTASHHSESAISDENFFVVIWL